MSRAVAAATAITVAILIGTVVFSVTTGSAIAESPRDTALRIKVTGHQWWWEIEYSDSVPARTLVTGNEMHVPIGEPIQVVVAGDGEHPVAVAGVDRFFGQARYEVRAPALHRVRFERGVWCRRRSVGMARLFEAAEIPWSELAFDSTTQALRDYLGAR